MATHRLTIIAALIGLLSCADAGNEKGDVASRTDAASATDSTVTTTFDTAWAASPADETRQVEFTHAGKSFRLITQDVNSATSPVAKTVLRIDVPAGFFIGRVRAASIHDDLVLLVDITGDETDNGIVARFDSRHARQWQHRIPAFNLANPVLRGNVAFLSGIGYVEKLDLATGQSVWKHEDLYEQDSDTFNAFQPAAFAGDTVIFQDYKGARAVKVLAESGEVVGR